MFLRKLLSALVCASALTVSAHAESSPHWTQVHSPHFLVITDSNEKQARHIASQFERMRSMFRDLLPYAKGDSGSRFTVFALRDRKSFEALEPASYLGAGQIKLAGLFLPTNSGNYVLLNLDASNEHHQYATIYHEYTHYLVRKLTWLPLWLNEGMAEFYQNTDIYDSSVLLGQPSEDDILYLREQKRIPVRTLLAVDQSSPYYHEEHKGSIFYSESWALTHMLMTEDFDHNTHLIKSYAVALIGGQDPVTAAQNAFGDLDQLDKRLGSYINGLTFKAVSLKRSYHEDESTYTAAPMPTPQANALRADVLWHNDREKEAVALDEEVLREDPRNAQAHVTLGMMALRANDWKKAHALLAEAVAEDTDDGFAQYAFGYSTLEGTYDAVEDKKAEASLRKAIALTPEFAPAFDALAHAIVVNHGDLAEAHRFNVSAVELDPTEVNYRLNAADVMMRSDQPESALSILDAAKHLLKDPTAQERLDARIKAIHEYVSARAANKATDNALAAAGESRGIPVGRVTVLEDTTPVLPAAAKPGPHKFAHGSMQNVVCVYPKGLTFELLEASGVQRFYTPDMFSLTLRTTNFTPTEDIDPCKVFAGMKAKVEYLPVTDKNYAGQMLNIDLTR